MQWRYQSNILVSTYTVINAHTTWQFDETTRRWDERRYRHDMMIDREVVVHSRFLTLASSLTVWPNAILKLGCPDVSYLVVCLLILRRNTLVGSANSHTSSRFHVLPLDSVQTPFSFYLLLWVLLRNRQTGSYWYKMYLFTHHYDKLNLVNVLIDVTLLIILWLFSLPYTLIITLIKELLQSFKNCYTYFE